MNNQSLVKINLEFAIIVSIMFFILGAEFFEKYGGKFLMALFMIKKLKGGKRKNV